jgi:hypothetical protein
MKIHGISHSSGAERQLTVEKGIDGVVLTILHKLTRKECGRIVVPGDALVNAIMGPREGGTIIDGLPQSHGPKLSLNVEVRRNEVWLTIRPGEMVDIAIGLDDIQDALEGVISRT